MLLLGLLVVLGFSIYGMVYLFVPHTFEYHDEKVFESDWNNLFETLEEYIYDEEDVLNMDTSLLQEFAKKHGVAIGLYSYDWTPIYEYKEYEDPINTSQIGEPLNKNIWLHGDAKIEPVSQVYLALLGMSPIIIPIILLISFIGAYFCSRYLARPIIELSEVAQKMAMLDFDYKSESKRNDEIGILSDSLNSLSESLHNNIEELKDKNIALHIEIEKEKQREREKNYLFSAISHELKTPLTILNCNIEGMFFDIGKYQDRKLYLEKSLLTIKSMSDLLNEILTITRMDSDDFRLLKTNVNLSKLLNDLFIAYQPMAEEKQLDFKADISQDFFIECNVSLVKKAISNIISNAIFYSPISETISIVLDEFGYLTICNTGVSILKEDLEQLFNPFYRVEKSRNRNSGGSGLGLFLVDRIFTLHEINYKMVSENNSVIFYTTFSKNEVLQPNTFQTNT